MIDWTEIIWRIIIALAPIIVSVVVAIVQGLVARMSQEHRAKLEYWVDVFIKQAQKLEPDPILRKQWVINRICAMFPNLPRDQIGALIEAILASNQLKAGVTWKGLAPKGTTQETIKPFA